MNPETTSSGYLFIHGGCHTSACWAQVAEHTARPSLAIDLPGRGARPARLSALTRLDFVQAIVDEVLGSGWDEVILVGHSMAGLTAPQAAVLLGNRVRHLVFISASIPDPGRSVVDMTVPPLRQYLHHRFARAARRADGVLDIPLSLARILFGNGLTAAERHMMLDNLVPDAPRLMIDPVEPVDLPSDLGRTYLGPVRDRTFPPPLQRRMARNIGAELVPVPGGHEVMYSHPDRLAAELDRIGNRVFDRREAA